MAPPKYPVAGTTVNTPGNRITSSLVPAAPTFPPPKTPKAMPFRRFGNQAEFHEIPAVKALPATPKPRAQVTNCQYSVARLNR